MALRDRDPAYMKLLKERQAQRIAATLPQPDAPLDTAKLDSLESDLGVPVSKSNIADYALGTFSAKELADAGMSGEALEKFGQVIKDREEAKTGVLGGIKYMPGLSVYEDALKTKAGIGQFQPGGSDLYATLGIKGFGALTADLAQKAAEQEQKYNSFSQALSSMATGQNVEFQSALNAYKLLTDEYNEKYKRIDEILAEQRKYENELNLYRAKSDIDKKIAEETGSDRTYIDVGGKSYYFNPATKQYEEVKVGQVDLKRGTPVPGYGTVTVDGGASGAWKYGLDLFQPYGTPVLARTSGKVISARRNGDFGYQVQVQLDDNTGGGTYDGSIIEYNHMGNLFVRDGQSVESGQQVGTFGNTGYVTDLAGNPYTEEQKNSPTHPGTHLDVTIRDKNGNVLMPTDSYNYLLTGKVGSVGGNIASLSKSELLQAKNLSVEIFGKVKGSLQENWEPIAEMIAEGRTMDEVRDELRYAKQSTLLSGQMRSAASALTLPMTPDASEKFMNELDRRLQENDTEGAKEYLKRGARVAAGQAEEDKRTGQEITVKLLDNIRADLARYEELGGDTGLISGNIYKLKEKLGGALGIDTELGKIAAKIAVALMTYRRSMTGAAFSSVESTEYKEIFPRIDYVSELNTSKLDALDESFSTELREFYRLAMGEGAYDAIFGKADVEETATVDNPYNFTY